MCIDVGSWFTYHARFIELSYMKNCKNQPPRKLRCEDHDPMPAWSSQQGLDQSKLHRESLSQKRKQQRQRNKQTNKPKN